MTRGQRQAGVVAVLLGVAATGAAAGAYGLGWMDWLEARTLDLRFRHANATPQHPGIVCIDIDDSALDLGGRWPWPRDVQAALVSVPAELGARAILLDITWDKPETVRPRLPPLLELEQDPFELDAGAPPLTWPDFELQQAIRRAGNVYLAAHYEERRHRAVPLLERVRAALDAAPELERLPPHELARRLHSGVTDRRFEDETPLKLELLDALAEELGRRAVLRRDVARLEQVHRAAPRFQAVTLHWGLARAARGCGFVNGPRDADGVVRRIPLLAHDGQRVLAHLALAYACDELGIGPEDIRMGPQRLEISLPRSGEKLSLQLDERGCVLIPWVATRGDWTTQFDHVPAGLIWQVHDRRRQQRHNQALLDQSRRDLFSAPGVPQYEQYARMLDEQDALQRSLRSAQYWGRLQEEQRCRQRLAQLDQQRAEHEQRIGAQLRQARATGAGAPSGGLDAAWLAAQLEALERLEDEVRLRHAALQSEIDQTLARLRPRLAGKVCLVGYTATSLADMVPIPTSPSAPGLIAHANILSGLLTGSSVRWASRTGNAFLAGGLGLLTTLIGAWRRPRDAALTALLCLVVFSAAVTVVFYRWSYWLAWTPAAGAMLGSSMVIAMYRYVFVDRQRRQLATALGQYTSREIARQVSEDAELCQRAEMREVTAMFTDLRGFTGISERIGAERTQRLLNICLGRLVDVMLRHEALVNKFIGDGIFAFWNPVIYPQPDHALRACETAVDLLAALEQLQLEQRALRGDEVFEELMIRVGVATGNAIVGPCGSEQKYDYTCIGDSVNVASRLESANKFFGTRILVSHATRVQVGERFVFRTLGGVQVKGKRQPVQVYELLGRAGTLDPSRVAWAEAFGRAVELFQQRQWDAAGHAFEALLDGHPDPAALHYLAAVRHFRAHAPPEDWTGALELLEK